MVHLSTGQDTGLYLELNKFTPSRRGPVDTGIRIEKQLVIFS